MLFVINCLITSCEWGHQILSVCSGSASLQIWRVDLPGEWERLKESERERERERGELWVSLRAHVTVCDWLPWRGFGWAERYCSVGVIRLLFLFSFNGVKQYQVIFCLKCAVFLQQTHANLSTNSRTSQKSVSQQPSLPLSIQTK